MHGCDFVCAIANCRDTQRVMNVVEKLLHPCRAPALPSSASLPKTVPVSLCSQLNPGISGSPLLGDYLTANPSPLPWWLLLLCKLECLLEKVNARIVCFRKKP